MPLRRSRTSALINTPHPAVNFHQPDSTQLKDKRAAAIGPEAVKTFPEPPRRGAVQITLGEDNELRVVGDRHRQFVIRRFAVARCRGEVRGRHRVRFQPSGRRKTKRAAPLERKVSGGWLLNRRRILR